jgi:hypothetical protein
MALVGLALAAACTAVILAVGTVLLGSARWIELPRPLPLAAWLIVGGLVIATLWWTFRALRRRASRDAVATVIEQERELRSGSLRGAIEVAGSGALGRLGAKQLGDRLSGGAPLAPLMQRNARWRALAGVAGAVLALATLGAARVATPDGWLALAHPVRAWRGTLAPPLHVIAPPMVLRGERVSVRIAALDRRHVTLYQRATGTPWRSSEHAVVGDTAAQLLGPVDADLILVAGDGRTVSDTVIMRVTDRPFVGDVSVRAQFPAYLRRADETLPTGEPARIPRGTVLSISGHASTALSGVSLVRDADTVRLSVNEHSFSGRFVAQQSGRWAWTARGRTADIADVPAPLELDVVPDSAPRIEIVSPATDTLVTGRGSIQLLVAALDDHGIAMVSLRSWRQPAEGRAQPTIDTRLGRPASTQWNGETTIDLGGRGLQPGDALHIVAIAVDGSPWVQTTLSRELVIRVPTASEQREMARDAADSAVNEAMAAVSAQRDLENRTGDAARARGQRSGESQASTASADSKDGKALSFESAEQARQLTAEQKALGERVEQLKKSAATMEEQLKQAGALDSGLASRLAEARALLAEALTPELAAQMKKLEDALQKLSSDDAQGALADLAQQQRQLREQLEKSAEILKRAALEGSMQTLKDEATELAAEQRKLADSLARMTGQRPDTSALKKELERVLEERSRDLAKDVNQLSQRLSQERAETGAKKSGDAARQAEQSATSMEKAAKASQSAQRQTGQGAAAEQKAGAQAADDAAKSMQGAANQLADARKSQIDEWKSELTNELDRSIQEMLQLARQQDQLEEKVRSGADPASVRGEQSALQQGVQKASERLQEAGQKSSLLAPQTQRAAGEAQAKVQSATKEASEPRSAGQTAAAMREASEALNKAASSLVRDRERANSASSASGFSEMLEQLQEMAQRQGGLNSASASLLQQGMSSPQAQEMARQLAKQQRSLARELDNLGDPTGKAEDLGREAQRIAEALDAGRVDPTTVARQQQLFRRMLDAGRTLEQDERDESGRREARAAKDVQEVIPQGPERGRDAVRFREPTWNELRGLSPEERRAVLEYFKRINGGGKP